MLEECYDQVDAISLHNYYGNTPALTGNDSVALPRDEPRHGAADPGDRRRLRLRAGALKRSPKRLWLSFDEWNVWYRARGGRFANGQRKFAPRLLEEEYNLEDALLVGGFLNTLLRQADRVRVGCLAQIVNVIAPLVTNETSVLRQTHLLPVRVGAQVRPRPRARSVVESETYPIKAEGLRPDFARDDSVPFLDVVATLDPQNGQACVLDAEPRPDGRARAPARLARPRRRRACSPARPSRAAT